MLRMLQVREVRGKNRTGNQGKVRESGLKSEKSQGISTSSETDCSHYFLTIDYTIIVTFVDSWLSLRAM
ncbi:hypothetical protein J6590_076717 [Homalodisca vitripennis]|nr:hypothetical protein J6590_076717 [Homalodisca vitripennis]